ncbi:MAG: tRNA 2-selenouridine(34) synthase MnmH [Rhodocyclaceae bacterium]|nr:tRNA 2-selenouridine(34) synthase MnmH [Rhodocyclaceae bacterium]MDZ4215115.1 tRNA 2-selenouridine(34) synthase MnmH [Rhodocyclaceae bacterium]
MAERQHKGVATIAQVGDFDAILDARSPGEFAEDHLPGATSCAVLSNDERARVGTLYKQASPFEAKKIGAVLVAKNIATHIETLFLDKPKDWKPLVYCWRGGKRSGAFAHILREIGWDAHRLEGGYKAWRKHVVEQLTRLPTQFQYRIISGPTGSAKSRILEAIGQLGGQILHLEELAAHKGSVLGNLPDAPQPAQKMFESKLFAALQTFDPARPVFAEAESRRIGKLQVPDALINGLRAAPCLRIDASRPARADFLLRDYDYFLQHPQWLIEQLSRLHGLQSNETLDHWTRQIEAGDFPALVADLLENHYDPLYQRSQDKNYRYADATVFAADDLSQASINMLARDILAA